MEMLSAGQGLEKEPVIIAEGIGAVALNIEHAQHLFSEDEGYGQFGVEGRLWPFVAAASSRRTARYRNRSLRIPSSVGWPMTCSS